MTLVKICGITNIEDAIACVELGADMLGFIFADSPRRVDVDTAVGIIEAMRIAAPSLPLGRDLKSRPNIASAACNRSNGNVVPSPPGEGVQSRSMPRFVGVFTEQSDDIPRHRAMNAAWTSCSFTADRAMSSPKRSAPERVIRVVPGQGRVQHRLAGGLSVGGTAICWTRIRKVWPAGPGRLSIGAWLFWPAACSESRLSCPAG